MDSSALSFLKSKKVKPEQYVAWAVDHFKFQTFLAGLGLAVLFSIPFLLVMAQNSGQRFWVAAFFAAFFIPLFLVSALSLRRHIPGDSLGLTQGMVAIGVLRFLDVKTMEKLSERTWNKIRVFTVPPAAVKGTHQFGHEQAFFRRLWKRCLLLLVVWALLTVLFPPSEAVRVLWGCTLAFFYLLGTFAVAGEIFFFSLQGFLNKDITLTGRYLSPTRYQGLVAQFWGVLGILLAVFIFLVIGVLPVVAVVSELVL